MQIRVALCVTSALFFECSVATAQEAATTEKIRDISPNKKFGMRIAYDAKTNQRLVAGEKADPAKIFSEAIKAIDLVSLPKKQKLVQLMPADDLGSNYDNVALVWSSDSKSCAFYYNQPHVGYTSVFQQRGQKFVQLGKPEKLRIDVKGDVRNEYVRPIKWTKPGILVLEQLSIFRGDENDSRFEFTVSFDANGKFHVTSKKNLQSEVTKKE